MRPPRVFDGDDDPPTEEVIRSSAALPGSSQPRRHRHLRRHALPMQMIQQRAPAVRCRSQLVLLDGRVGHPAASKILETGSSLSPSEQGGPEEVRRKLAHIVQVASPADPVAFLCGQLPILDLDPDPLAQLLGGLEEAHAPCLHEELEGIAPLPTAKAVVDALVLHHVEAWCLLLVEGTQPDVRVALPLQGHGLGDHLDDVGSLTDGLDELAGEHRSSRAAASSIPALSRSRPAPPR